MRDRSRFFDLQRNRLRNFGDVDRIQTFDVAVEGQFEIAMSNSLLSEGDGALDWTSANDPACNV